MPVQFLSDEWTVQLKQRLNESEAFRAAAAGANATVQNVIATPDGQKRYWIRISGGDVDMGPGDAEQPDATIEQDYETAAALARSELNPVSAFMTGKIRINGSMMLLMQLQGALTELAREMQELDVEY
ncbi:MAG: SCP2 sterol-binding domain-containing protein [Actinomycetota bacterium]